MSSALSGLSVSGMPLAKTQVRQARLSTPQQPFAPKFTDVLNLRFGAESANPFLEGKVNELKALGSQLSDLGNIGAVISWDQQTWPLGQGKSLPPKGLEGRASQLSTLAALGHELQTSQKMGDLVSFLTAGENFSRLSGDEQQLVTVMAKDYADASKIPAALVMKKAEVTSKAHVAWEEARKDNDFSKFSPYLKEIVGLCREQAKAIGYQDSPYDALLDLYEPGMTTKQLDALFGDLKGQLTQVLKSIQEKPAPQTSFLTRYFSSKKQFKVAKMILEAMGFDFSRGAIAMSTHPFTSGMGGSKDVRLTIRTREHSLMDSIGAAIHEGGHGIYEQGVSEKWMGTPVSGGTSLGVHETQSRIYELMVGQSKQFWSNFLDKVKGVFPQQLSNVMLDDFYKAINKVEPSLIRVEADEVTYILHIIVRYEIEKALIEGKLEVEDVPKAWNGKMQEYLGITPPNDAKGCLQDVHWSFGGLGYFPTYAIGTLGAAQIFNAAKKDIPEMGTNITPEALGKFKTWLNEKVHQNGRADAPSKIFQQATGEPLNAKYFIDYLWTKYADLYGIQRPAS